MGFCCSKDDMTHNPGDKTSKRGPSGPVTSTQNFNPGNFALINENKNKITREYNVLSPALGRGAFGEVRQAIHRETGMVRAIKIVFKEISKPNDLSRIVKEVRRRCLNSYNSETKFGADPLFGTFSPLCFF